MSKASKNEVNQKRLDLLRSEIDRVIASGFSQEVAREVASRFSTPPGSFLPLCNRVLRRANLSQQKAVALMVSKVEGEEVNAFLKALLDREEIGIEVKDFILSDLKEKGVKVPARVELLVSQGSSWLSRAFSTFSGQPEPALSSSREEAGGEELSLLSQELVSFPRELQRRLLQRLSDEGERALPFLKKVFGLSIEVDELIAQTLSRIPCQAAASLLDEIIAQARDKKVEKAARKSVFLLQGRGVPVKTYLKKEVAPIQVMREEEENRAFVSGIDYLGSRLLWLVKAQLSRGSYLLHAVLRDSVGIADFVSHETTRRGTRQYLEKVLAEKWLIAEVEYSYGCYLLEEAYATNLRRGIDAPREYLNLRTRLRASIKEETGPLIYRLLKLKQAREEDFPVGIQGKVGQIPELSSWRVEPELLEKHGKKVVEVKESRILVTPEQKRTALGEIYEKAAREIFDEDGRMLYKRRLEEMAALFFLKKREQDARVALAAAISLEKGSPLLPVNPFALELTKRGISFLLKEEETATPALITPWGA